MSKLPVHPQSFEPLMISIFFSTLGKADQPLSKMQHPIDAGHTASVAAMPHTEASIAPPTPQTPSIQITCHNQTFSSPQTPSGFQTPPGIQTPPPTQASTSDHSDKNSPSIKTSQPEEASPLPTDIFEQSLCFVTTSPIETRC